MKAILSALLILPVPAYAQSFPDGTGTAPASELSNTDLGVRAAYRFTEYPERACPAAEEFSRRGVQNSKSFAIAETILPYCRKLKTASRRAPASVSAPPLGRYTCLRTGFTGNSVADDLTIQAGGRYSVGGGAGQFSYSGNSLVFATGPWATARSNWIGQFVPAGASAKYPTIVVRDRRDVAAGNKRDLQWCNFAG